MFPVKSHSLWFTNKKVMLHRFCRTPYLQLISLISNTTLTGNTKTINIMKSNRKMNKDKVVPIHVVKAYMGMRGTAPLILNLGIWSRCQLHVLAALHLGKEPPAITE
jgi:hypothetical protein